MRKSLRMLALALLVCLALSVMPAHALYNTEMFSDVPGESWYCAAACYANDHGLMQGTEQLRFSPDTTYTCTYRAFVF